MDILWSVDSLPENIHGTPFISKELLLQSRHLFAGLGGELTLSSLEVSPYGMPLSWDEIFYTTNCSYVTLPWKPNMIFFFFYITFRRSLKLFETRSHPTWLSFKIMMWEGWYFHWGSWMEMCKVCVIQDDTITEIYHTSIILPYQAHSQHSSYLVLEYLPCWTTNKTSRTVILSSCVWMFLLSIPMPPEEPGKPPGQRTFYESKTRVPNVFSYNDQTKPKLPKLSKGILSLFVLFPPSPTKNFHHQGVVSYPQPKPPASNSKSSDFRRSTCDNINLVGRKIIRFKSHHHLTKS